MNCKPGDLALIVRAAVRENVGKVVRCIEVVPATSVLYRTDIGPVWRIDRALPTLYGDTSPHVHDCRLMPINPLSDESQRSQVTVDARHDV